MVLAVKKRYSWFLILGKVDLNCITRLPYNEEVDIPHDIKVDTNRIKAVERDLKLSSKVLFKQGFFRMNKIQPMWHQNLHNW